MEDHHDPEWHLMSHHTIVPHMGEMCFLLPLEQSWGKLVFIQMALKSVSLDLHALRLNPSPLGIHMLILHTA